MIILGTSREVKFCRAVTFRVVASIHSPGIYNVVLGSMRPPAVISRRLSAEVYYPRVDSPITNVAPRRRR